MPKTNKRSKTGSPVTVQTKTLFNLTPWSSRHFPDHSEIEAYVIAKGDWETVAEVRTTAYVSSEETANFIIRAVNNYERHQKLIGELVAALELCLQCEGITWEAEQEADHVLRRIKGD